MIDLHIHTTYSDGTDDLITILEKAESKKLNFISITDHNSCGAYEEMSNIENIKKYFNGTIITGVELNTKVMGVPIEILGYNFNPNILAPLLKETYISTKERNLLELTRIYEKCKNIGIDVGDDFLQNYDSNIYTSQYLHSILTKNKENKKYLDEDSWNKSTSFYRNYMSNPQTPFYVDMDDVLPNFERASTLIKESGGLVFLPHLFEYKENSIKILNNILDNYKIDGIECYYTSFTYEQHNFLTSLCNMKNLLVSGGSDYHGSYKPNVDLGSGYGNLSIPDKIIHNWKFRLDIMCSKCYNLYIDLANPKELMHFGSCRHMTGGREYGCESCRKQRSPLDCCDRLGWLWQNHACRQSGGLLPAESTESETVSFTSR